MSDTTIVSGGSFDLSTPLSGTNIEFLNGTLAAGFLQIDPGAFENRTVVITGTPVVETYIGGNVQNFAAGDLILVTNLATDYAEFDHAPSGVTAAQNAEVSLALSEIVSAEQVVGTEVITVSASGVVTDNHGLLASAGTVGNDIEVYVTSIEQALFGTGAVTADLFIEITPDTSGGGVADALLTTDGTLDAICYLRGTHLLTPAGECAVEALAAGDLLVTRASGFQKIKWIGEQLYDARFVARNRNKMPVRIMAGALGDGVPARDLFVSPGHSMLLDGVLVLARNLVNGVTIRQEEVAGEIHYYQVEFEKHDCVIAEGAWSESFADGPGLRNQFHNVVEFYALYPDYVEPDALALCAARPEAGPALEAALRPVLARAGAGITPGGLRGFVDLVTPEGVVEGWAQDMGNPEFPVLLEVFAGETLLGSVLACAYREDLEKAGIGRGQAKFSFDAGRELSLEERRGVVVRRALDGAVLAMSEACLGGVGLGLRRAG